MQGPLGSSARTRRSMRMFFVESEGSGHGPPEAEALDREGGAGGDVVLIGGRDDEAAEAAELLF